MDRLLAILVLSSGFALTALQAAERTITISNHETTTWQCVPAGTTDTSSAVTRFSGLDVGTAHRLIPIGPGNNPPIAQDLDATVDEDGSVVIDLIATDPDGDPLTFLVAGQPEHGLASVDGAQITYAPEADFFGSDQFTYAAIDGTDVGPAATVRVTVNPSQDPPTAAFTSNATQLELRVNASGSYDIDGDTITTYAWDWGDGSSDPASNTTTASHTYAENGVYTVTLTVTDEQGATDTVSNRVAVSDGTGNTPPVVNDMTFIGREGENLHFVLEGFDADGDALRFTADWSNQPTSTQWNRDTGEGVVRFNESSRNPDWHGEFTIMFSASDGQAESAPATATMIIEPVNDGPTPGFVILRNATPLGVQVDASRTEDLEGDRLVNFVWDWGDGTTSVNGTDPTARHVYSEARSYMVKLTVTDEYGASGSIELPVVPLLGGTDVGGHGGLSMRALDGGSFIMGENEVTDRYDTGDEGPEHLVTLSPFAISAYEVTNAQYADVLNWAIDQGLATANDQEVTHDGVLLFEKERVRLHKLQWNGSELVVEDGTADQPVIDLTWHGAAAFCAYLNLREGLEQAIDLETWTIDFDKDGYRLPSEAEWEYAARGGLAQKNFPWGDVYHRGLANHTHSLPPYFNDYAASPVGYYPPNGFGLYDMVGNAYEPCADWYDADYYQDSPEHDPRGPATGSRHVRRGGQYNLGQFALYVSKRSPFGNAMNGLRVARSNFQAINQ